MRFTWRKQSSERGLARMCQGPRGAMLKVDGEDVGGVYSSPIGRHQYEGWYWVARSDRYSVPLRNTCATPVASIDVAKAQCESYVRSCLSAAAAAKREATR